MDRSQQIQTTSSQNGDFKVNFRARWKNFLSALFGPNVLIPLISTFIFGYLSVEASGLVSKTISSVVMGIFASIAGAMLTKSVLDETRKGQIFTRGQSAVRGLNLILADLSALEAQLEKARAESSDDTNKKDFYYIKSLCILVQRQTINAIEEWKDILPEADIIELIESLKTKLQQTDDLREALTDVQAKLDDSKNNVSNQQGEVEKLRRQKNELERKLRETESELWRSFPLGTSPSLTTPLLNTSQSRVKFDDEGNIYFKTDD